MADKKISQNKQKKTKDSINPLWYFVFLPLIIKKNQELHTSFKM